MTMEKRKSVPIVHVVYDFRHRAGKTKKGVVDVCVTYCGKRKYISTGVKVFPSEWDRRDCAVRNRLDAEELNARVAAVRSRVNGYVSGCIGDGSAFSLDEMVRHVGAVRETGSFVDFVSAEIEADNGIAGAERLNVIGRHVRLDMYWRVREDAMMPKFMRGDILALAHLPKGAVFPNGSPMVVDTRPFGFVFRRVYDIGDALDCRVANKESGYTDTVMQKSQVIRLYRVVGLLRIGN